MSCSNTEMLLGDFLSPFSQQCLVADEGLGLLDDYLEVAKNFSSHGFSSAKAKMGFSDWLDVGSWNNATDSNQGKINYILPIFGNLLRLLMHLFKCI